MSDKKRTTCPKCLGSTEVFNGRYAKKCDLCTDGKVSYDIEEAYIDEQLPYE